jgi:hypothetical protein
MSDSVTRTSEQTLSERVLFMFTAVWSYLPHTGVLLAMAGLLVGFDDGMGHAFDV